MEVEVTDANFKEEVLESGLPVLVDFWAFWCAPCRMVAPVIEEVAKEYEEQLKVCKVNVDEALATASEYGIKSIPTLAIFKNGQVVEKVIGAVPKTVLGEKIKTHINILDD
ncbi:MAG: thioredoxin [Nitrospirae bacterium]|nr:thioredoxin [Nitrospirota bacterium]